MVQREVLEEKISEELIGAASKNEKRIRVCVEAYLMISQLVEEMKKSIREIVLKEKKSEESIRKASKIEELNRKSVEACLKINQLMEKMEKVVQEEVLEGKNSEKSIRQVSEIRKLIRGRVEAYLKVNQWVEEKEKFTRVEFWDEIISPVKLTVMSVKINKLIRELEEERSKSSLLTKEFERLTELIRMKEC